MNATVIVIGTELTRGIIQDKNGSLVSRELTQLGVHVNEIVAVPDDGTITPVLAAVERSSDLVVISGGLGPTTDDMTRSAIAEAAGVPLVRDPWCWDFLQRRLGPKAYGANEKQAWIPQGFTPIPNNHGTAPGFYGYAGKVLITALPGPPRELSPMLYDTVLPLIRRALDLPEVERDEYSSFITAEAKLEELYESVDPGLEWATRFQDYRISLYVSGKTKAERDEAVSRLRGLLGEGRLADGDTEALSILTGKLKERGETVSVAESCTGGLLSQLLTSQAGSSAYMLGSVTSYAAAVKRDVLGVPQETIDNHGTVSAECAIAMAEGVRKLTGSDWAASVTGVAGPDTDEGKSVGTVFLGFSGKGRKAEAAELHFNSWGRESVRKRSSVAAMIFLSLYMDGRSAAEAAKGWRHI